MKAIIHHPLFVGLRDLKGNARAGVFTELMFGVPYNLFFPFFSVYMLALGVSDQQIGTVASVGLVFQIFTTLISGVFVDKFGRRLTLFVCDLISWSVPCLIWAVAQDVRYFIIGAVINAIFRIAHNAWTCLLIEDSKPHQLVHIWTWIAIFGTCASFFTPLGGWFVSRFGLIPAMRGLLVFGFAMLTAKAVVTYLYTRETERGKRRIEETRHQPFSSLLKEYHGVFGQLLHSKKLLAALSLMLIVNIYFTVSSSFWGVLFTGKLGFADSQISIYVMLRSLFTATGFFLVGPKFKNLLHFRLPLWVGFSIYFVSQVMLVFMPPQAVGLMITSVVLEGAAASFVSPIIESLLAAALESHERARISAMVYAILLLFTSPFGWIAGQLSALDRSLPFVLTAFLFVIGAGLVWLIDRRQDPVPAHAE